MDRQAAWSLVQEHTPSLALQRHMLGVEACMRWYAARAGADEEAWGIAGLLHDFDYEQHPDEHPLWGLALLHEAGIAPEIAEAIAAHYPEKTGVEPVSPIARHLYACDELTGFVFAVAYVRPSRDVRDVEVGSVLKKLKTPSFAAAVSRDDIHRGAGLIGLGLDEHIANVLAALGGEAGALGLAGPDQVP
jgi:predicted hydrolase (HD superfamily)